MKYLILAIFLAISIQSFGQFNKGDKVLGGTLSFSTSKNENSQFGSLSASNTTIGFYPNFGVLVNSNLETGIQVGYSSSNYEWSGTDATSDRKSNYWTAGFYGRRYFVISEKFLFSLMASINYSEEKDKTLTTNQVDIIENESKRNSLGVAVSPSFIFFPSPKWAFQASIGSLGYAHTKNKTTDDTSNQFNINYGYVGLGIAYYFRREAE